MEQKIHNNRINVDLSRSPFATKVDVFIDNNIKSFQLAVLQKNYWWKKDEENEIEYFIGYVNIADKTYTTSLYSGGATGCGIDPSYINPFGGEEGVQVAAIELDEIIKMVKAANKQAATEEKEFQMKQTEKANRINQLPEIFDVPGFPELQINRSKAEYRNSYSRKVQGGGVGLGFRGKKQCIFISDFVTKSGALRTKDFAAQYSDLIGNRNPKEVLQSLIEAVNNVKKIISNA